MGGAISLKKHTSNKVCSRIAKRAASLFIKILGVSSAVNATLSSGLSGRLEINQKQSC